MRKHVVIVSEESVFAGRYHCGIGEVVDCMASALRQYYDVTVVTIGNRKGGKARGTITLGVEGDAFYAAAAECVNEIQPDLVHNFGRADLISRLDVECPKIITFDRWEEDAEAYLEYMPLYDHVTTLSTAYANEMIAAHSEAAAWPLVGILAGIDKGLYSLKGSDKSDARAKMYKSFGREDTGKTLIVSMGRLKHIKGIDLIIAEAADIAAAGADLFIWGTGEEEYEQQLTDLHNAGVLTYTNRMCDYFEMMQALRAADFYLMPSRSEVCGLQPMKAAYNGCVPIIARVGGMAENFDENTAVFIEGSIAEAVQRAVALPEAKYAAMRQAGIDGTWTWDTRILPWVELYGLPTAKRKFVEPQIDVAPVKLVSRTEREIRTCPFARKEDVSNG